MIPLRTNQLRNVAERKKVQLIVFSFASGGREYFLILETEIFVYTLESNAISTLCTCTYSNLILCLHVYCFSRYCRIS
jgi:hypothetical protein